MEVVVDFFKSMSQMSRTQNRRHRWADFSAHSSASTLPATATSRELKSVLNLGKMKDPPSFATRSLDTVQHYHGEKGQVMSSSPVQAYSNLPHWHEFGIKRLYGRITE